MSDQRLYEVTALVTAHCNNDNAHDLLSTQIAGIRFPYTMQRIGTVVVLFIQADGVDEAEDQAINVLRRALGDQDHPVGERDYAIRIDQEPFEVQVANTVSPAGRHTSAA